jgi:hypothetical protein
VTPEGDEPPGELPPDPVQEERLRFARKLLVLFPEVRSDILDEENSYESAGTVALRARDLIREGTGADDPRMRGLFAVLEEGARDPSLNVQELAAFGVIEVMQDFPECDALAEALLGQAGKALWAEVHQFWGTGRSNEP